MSTYVLVYRAPKNYTGSPDTGETWNNWFNSWGPARSSGLGRPRPCSLGRNHTQRTIVCNGSDGTDETVRFGGPSRAPRDSGPTGTQRRAKEG